MESLGAYVGAFLAMLMLTCFVKIFTSLTILRYGLGLETAGFGIVIIGVSLALSLVVMDPHLSKLGGYHLLLGTQNAVPQADLEKGLRPFLEKNTEKETIARLQKLTTEKNTPADAAGKDALASFPVLQAAFILSQLKEAFQLGFMILLPFLVIDLLVINILMALGVQSLAPAVVALPLKILAFFAVDGWTLISEKLIGAYFQS